MNKEYLTYENKILGQEIERLAKEVEKLEKVNQMLLNSMVTEAHTKETKEIERLNNIINELEKFLDEDYEFADTKVFPGAMAGVAMGQINRTKNKLQELKGSDKE